MLEGWREKLPLSPPHMEGEARKGKAMPCPALLNPNSLCTALVIL